MPQQVASSTLHLWISLSHTEQAIVIGAAWVSAHKELDPNPSTIPGLQ
jgi:hypothetical protein